MDIRAISLAAKLDLIEEQWSPRIIAQMNDVQFKLVKIQGAFVWHSHPETDEVFVVIEGNMGIDFRDGQVKLRTGEMLVVPRGVEHRPFAEQECKVLLVEPTGTVNTGDTGGERTKPADAWI